MRPSTQTRLLRGASGALCLTVAAAIAIHLPPVRRFLAGHAHPSSGACPFGYGATAAADPDRHRARLQALRGTTPARARPALGFALDTTTSAELLRWAASHAVTCDAQHGGAQIACADVPGGLVPGAGELPLTSLVFELDSARTLTGIKTVRRDRDAGAVSAAFAGLQNDLTARAGAPSRAEGSAAPAKLASGALRQAMVEYRFTDYRAVVRATNMGDGFVLTEEYMTLAD